MLSGGVEKILRIYDLNRPDAPPREVDKSPGSVRTVAWLHSDQTILSSCTDMGGVRYVPNRASNATSFLGSYHNELFFCSTYKLNFHVIMGCNIGLSLA